MTTRTDAPGAGPFKSKAKTRTGDTREPGPSSFKPKTIASDTLPLPKPKTLDLFTKSKKDMFSLAPSKPKMLDVLTASKAKNVPLDATLSSSSSKLKSETPKLTKMLGLKPVVNQPGLKPKSAPPPPPPPDHKTLMELHYSRYLRAVLTNNVAQLEDHYAKKVIQLQESRAATKKAQMVKERAALKTANSNMWDKKRDIEEAEILVNQYKPVVNLSAAVHDNLKKLAIALEDKTNTLPVVNCGLTQPVDHESFEEAISGVNATFRRETEGLGAKVVNTSNNKDCAAEELGKVESEGDWMHKRIIHTAILASMKATVNKEYAVEFENEEDEECLSSFTGSVVFGKVENSLGLAELSSIEFENEGPTLEREYEETLPLDEDLNVDILSLFKKK